MRTAITLGLEPEMITGEWRNIRDRVRIANNQMLKNKPDIIDSEDNDG